LLSCAATHTSITADRSSGVSASVVNIVTTISRFSSEVTRTASRVGRRNVCMRRDPRKMQSSRSFVAAMIGCVIHVERLRSAAAAFDQVFRWHWLEWGVQDPTADEAEWRQRLASRSGDFGIPFTLVADLDGEPVGCVSVCYDDRDSRYADHGPWLSGMVVVGPARNMGVGRALLSAAAENASGASATELWVWTTEAGPFYERCAYRYAHRKDGLRDCSVLSLAL
jgi:GNAT superfamily N-acetyltransferase